MAEYIEREATITVLKNLLMQTAFNSVDADYGDYALCDIYEEIAQNRIKRWVEILPAADVVPVVHGHWEDREENDNHYVYCSECGDEYIENEFRLDSWVKQYFHYCPNCGARMDEDG